VAIALLCLLQQALGRVHHVHVGLVAARGRDHVDHLLDHVHVGHGHVAVVVGQRMIGVMQPPRRGAVLDDVGHPHAGGAALGVHHLRLEQHLTRLVRLPVGPGHAVGVGQVAGDHVEPLALRADCGAGDLEHLEQGHRDLL
jgi:hypothetical protein